jgi:hypothetical protein
MLLRSFVDFKNGQMKKFKLTECQNNQRMYTCRYVPTYVLITSPTLT